MWWNKKDRDDKAKASKEQRDRLTAKVDELDRERGHLEELMKRMLDERAKDAH